MTQHITIISPTEVIPDMAGIWRDDQTLMWGFDPLSTLAWPPDDPEPIKFAMDDPNFAPWPGTKPQPVGDKPESGPDKRFYIALAQMIMPAGERTFYRYTLNVVDENNQVRQVKVRRTADDGSMIVIDPDVENHPQP